MLLLVSFGYQFVRNSLQQPSGKHCKQECLVLSISLAVSAKMAALIIQPALQGQTHWGISYHSDKSGLKKASGNCGPCLNLKAVSEECCLFLLPTLQIAGAQQGKAGCNYLFRASPSAYLKVGNEAWVKEATYSKEKAKH